MKELARRPRGILFQEVGCFRWRTTESSSIPRVFKLAESSPNPRRIKEDAEHEGVRVTLAQRAERASTDGCQRRSLTRSEGATSAEREGFEPCERRWR
jgi:hypothetical protein